MNQRRIRGETTLDALQRAYSQTAYRAAADRICAHLDVVEAYSPAKQKHEALVLARYYINRSR